MEQTLNVVWSSIGLQDRTQKGHCKFLTLHLIDPRRPIISTAMVPCQRRDWWAEELRRTVGVLSRLPQEIFDRIIEVSLYNYSW